MAEDGGGGGALAAAPLSACIQQQEEQERCDLVGFTLIVDDIVLHDGRTCMEQLGGGGPQTLWGFQLASSCLGRRARLGLSAGVGTDLPEAFREWLRGVGADTSGLAAGPLPTPRAWQLFEQDGRRTQVWRVEETEGLYKQLRPAFAELPPALQGARAYHLGIHAGHAPMRLLEALREAAGDGGVLSVEPYTPCDEPPPEGELRAMLRLPHIFSPNEAEAASIVGPGSPEQLAARLLAAGASAVSLRLGASGALVAHGPSGGAWHVPAVPGTRVVDVTGCGNAFCGGLLAARQAGLGWPDAARWGCVAGSLMAEHQGVPPADVRAMADAARRKFALLSALPAEPVRLPPVAAEAAESRAVRAGAAAAVPPTKKRPPQLRRVLAPGAAAPRAPAAVRGGRLL